MAGEMSFTRVLIANRGEIARRIQRGCRKLGLENVAVFSEADRDAPFVAEADHAVCIGGAAPSDSYLNVEAILEAARATGAGAVHPGYGFLSENAGFAAAVEAAGLVFIGPEPDAIARMGSKIEAKAAAEAAGVPVLPGYRGEDQSDARLLQEAEALGTPFLVKASAGGGGRGMRLVSDLGDAPEAIASARAEAQSAFGDPAVFLERYAPRARHVEVQVLGDTHGTVLHLGDRDCSLQRNHQKLIEEAPAADLPEAVRDRMRAAAVRLALAIGYRSAGTVEYLYDPGRGEYYFLEMNTRLQVEHPVTEAITGIDLVEQMIRIAAGEKLEMTQDDIGIDGWSIENRVYAEDPYRGFLPSIGRLVRYDPPVEGWTDDGSANGRRGVDGVRVDDGVYEGGEVSMFYDPMIAKLVTWGETRDEAADLQVQALDAFRIEGLGHNVDFLSAIMQHPRFRSGELTTGFIAEEYPDGFQGAAASDDLKRGLAAIAGVIATADADRARRIEGQLSDDLYAPGDWTVRLGDTDYRVTLEEEAITVDDAPVALQMEYTPGERMVEVELDDETLTLQLEPKRTGYAITTRGAKHTVRILQTRIAHLADHMIEKIPPDLSKMLICPMPGLLVKLHVEEGEEVQPGQPLATVEAMKMENILRAEKEGTIAKINAEEGESLAVDAVILELE